MIPQAPGRRDPIARLLLSASLLALALALGLASATGPASAQVLPLIQFASPGFPILEGSTGVEINVTVVGPRAGSVSVTYTMVDRSAQAYVDYSPESGTLVWGSGDPDLKLIHTGALSDAVPESTESFQVLLSSPIGATIGTPNPITMQIVDVPPPPVTAAIVIPPNMPLDVNGQYVLFGNASTGMDIPVHVANATSWPLTVPYSLDGSPPSHSLIFQQGETDLPITLPAEVVPPGATQVSHLVALSTPAAGKTDVTAAVASEQGLAQIQQETGASGAGCAWTVVCFIDKIFHLCPCTSLTINCHSLTKALASGTSSSRPAQPTVDPITTLQQYRDQILTPTAVGRYYVNLYQQLSPDAEVALLRQPFFLYEFFSASQPWVDGISALLAGTGDSFVISTDMVQGLEALLADFVTYGSPGLGAALQQEWSRLDVANLPGQNMTQFQQQVQALGGRVPDPARSWGSVKATFGSTSVTKH
jgi:hypothetical protein